MSLSKDKSVVFALQDNNLSKLIMSEFSKMYKQDIELNSKVIFIDKKTSRIDVLAKNNSIIIGINLNTNELLSNKNAQNASIVCSKPKEYYEQHYKKINLVAFQRHLLSNEILDNLELNGKPHISLGLINQELNSAERIFRTSNLINLDLSSIRYGDLPTNSNANPAGLNIEQFIQLSKLAGYSDNISLLNFEVNKELQQSSSFTSKLIATCFWYFLESVNQIKNDDKHSESMSLVEMPESDDFLYFYKSNMTGKCSYAKSQESNKNPCSVEEYDTAVNKGIISERILSLVKESLDFISLQ